jgi:hypothetical protein
MMSSPHMGRKFEGKKKKHKFSYFLFSNFKENKLKREGE